MAQALKKLIIKYLKEITDRIESDSSYMSEEEQIDLLRVIAHRALSKDEACSFMNLQRSRFDDLVRLGKIPRGRKLRGRQNALSWSSWYVNNLWSNY